MNEQEIKMNEQEIKMNEQEIKMNEWEIKEGQDNIAIKDDDAEDLSNKLNVTFKIGDVSQTPEDDAQLCTKSSDTISGTLNGDTTDTTADATADANVEAPADTTADTTADANVEANVEAPADTTSDANADITTDANAYTPAAERSHTPIASQKDFSDDDNESIKEHNGHLLDTVFQSMSNVISALTLDMQTLNSKLERLQINVMAVCGSYEEKFTDLKKDHDNIKLHKNNLTDVHRQLLDTRSSILQMLGTNIADLKREVMDVRKIKDELRQQIKLVIVEEMNDYMSKMPTLENKFTSLEKDLRANQAQYLRKSMVQKVNSISTDTSSLIEIIKQQIKETSTTGDIESLRAQQLEFMNKVERTIVEMKSKLDMLQT